jgi:D-serine deaminase-like pyridoxal phosphate-dependent protein
MTIKTPTLLLDEALCRKNIREMAEKTAAMGLTFRPHFKTHQSQKTGRWFREYGVDKICVSSVRMADYFCEDGWEDILIAFPYNPREVNEIRHLAGKTNLGLCITGPQSAELLARDCNFKVSVMIKTDTGYGRSGSLWNNSAGLLETYRILKQCKYISIKGLMTHSGNTYKAKSREEIQEISELSAERLIYARESIGDPSLLLSVGDTPSASVCNEFTGIDELRPGNFVFSGGCVRAGTAV